MSLRYLSWPWIAGLLIILSAALHATLITQFSSSIAGDLGDPLLNTWIQNISDQTPSVPVNGPSERGFQEFINHCCRIAWIVANVADGRLGWRSVFPLRFSKK